MIAEHLIRGFELSDAPRERPRDAGGEGGAEAGERANEAIAAALQAREDAETEAAACRERALAAEQRACNGSSLGLCLSLIMTSSISVVNCVACEVNLIFFEQY